MRPKFVIDDSGLLNGWVRGVQGFEERSVFGRGLRPGAILFSSWWHFGEAVGSFDAHDDKKCKNNSLNLGTYPCLPRCF